VGKASRSNPNVKLLALPVLQDRACGACTACCEVLQVDELRKPARQLCEHAKPAHGGSCGIWGDRERQPPLCRAWHCLWRKGMGAEEERPDQSGVMLQPSVGYIPGTKQLGISAHELRPGALDEPATRAYLERIADGRTVYGVRPLRSCYVDDEGNPRVGVVVDERARTKYLLIVKGPYEGPYITNIPEEEI